MFRGYYTAASGMLSQMKRQEMITNNIANANTPGYKADRSSLRAFPQMLLSRIGGDQTPAQEEIGGIATGVYLQESMPKFIQGDLIETGNGTDVALLQGNVPVNGETNREGMLFFALQTGQGDIRYTRNGNFTVDGAGNLVDSYGNFVLGTDGEPIVVEDSDFTVDPNGTVIDNGGVIGQIDIAVAENPLDLMKAGNGQFRLAEDGGAPLPSAVGNEEITYQLKQQFLERSNVDPQQAMTELLSSYRSLEANQKVLQAYDRSMQKAVNEVGRIG